MSDRSDSIPELSDAVADLTDLDAYRTKGKKGEPIALLVLHVWKIDGVEHSTRHRWALAADPDLAVKMARKILQEFG